MSYISGGSEDNVLTGTPSDDTINGGRGQDQADGGGGSDLLIVDYSGNTFAGTSSYSAGMTMGVGASYLPEEDRYDNYGSASAYRAVSAQDYVSFSHIERFDVRGTPAADNVYGGGGDDTLSGNGGNDSLRGGAGSDSLVGGSGSDLIEGDAGDDTLNGGDGDDSFKSGWSNSDAVLQTDWIDGGSGVDVLEGANFSQLKSGYLLRDDGTVHAAVTLSGGMRASGVEYITSARLGSGNDTVAFTTVRDNPFIVTGDGDDTINSGRGQDYVDGGGGSDVLVVDYSGNTFAGTSSYSAGMTMGVSPSYLPEEDRYENSGGASAYRAVSAQDSVSFSHIERFDVRGTPAVDNVYGGFGDDTLSGNGGNDSLRGGAGSDSLVGGSGSDLIEGDAGDDTLDGGDGDDSFKTGWSNSDAVLQTDWIEGGSGVDVLEGANFSQLKSGYLLKDDGTVHAAVTLTGGMRASGVEYITSARLGSGNDTVAFTTVRDNPFIMTGDGDDTINGGRGQDYVDGGGGSDVLIVDYSGNTFAGTSSYSAGMTMGVSASYLPEEERYENSGGASAYRAVSAQDYVSFSHIERFDVRGTPAVDNVSGGFGDDTLSGNGGNDTLRGGAGSDSLVGGSGSDLIEGDAGDDTLDGGDGDDSFKSGWSNSDAVLQGDWIEGGSGVDVLEGANFSQLKSGYLLKDDGTVHAAVTLTGGMRASGVEYITSARLGSGNDTVAFTTVRDNPFIMTGDGDDTINGGRGQDYVDGGGGSDVLVVDYSGNTFDGTSSYSAGMTMGVSASYLPEEDRYENYGSASAYRAVSAQDYVSFYHIERFDVRGTPAVDNVYGGFGDDTLSGNGGNDTLRGGAGSDSLVGGSGSDLIEGDAGDDTLDGGDGDDSFKSGWASSDAVLQTGWIEGGSGVDTLEGANFSQLKSGYLLKDDGTVHAAVTLAGGMRASGLEYITSGRLGSGNDTVAFTTVRDNPFIETGDGDDTINGGRGQDNVDGGGGIDVLVVDYSGNTFAGTSSYSAGMTLNVGSSYLQSEDRNDNYGSASAFRSVGLQDSVSFSHIERLDVKGTPAADALNGGSGSDTLSGNGGNDTLRGGAGADSLVGGSGTDLMEGNEGDDTLCVDGAAAATVAGGAGRDVLRFTNYTVIPAVVFSDFEPGAGGDIVDASALVKGFKGYTGGNPFTGGYLKVVQSGADALLQFGADGNKTAAYKTLVRFSGVSAAKLVSENFLPSSALFVDETPVGNSGNDSASGNTGKNLLEGGSGDDTLSGLAGDDTLIGGEGDDSLNGGSGNDSILGGLGNDVLESGDGIDIIDGGSGTDYLSVDWLKFSKARIEGSFQQSGSGAGASFSGFYAAKDAGGAVLSSVKFSGIENLTINAKAIDLTAGAVSPTAVPGVSLHRVSASALTSEQGGKVEYDVALRKAPKDTVKVQFTVSDTTEGKLSARELVFNATDWNKPKRLTVVGVDDYLDDGNIAYNVVGKIVTGDLTYNRVTVPSLNLVNNDDAEDAPLVFKGSRDVDYFQGKNGNDRIYGGLDQDKLLGGRGDDKIYGEEDDDRLFGEGGNDKLYGFYDDDLLDGGEGDDSLFGEQGLDTLVGGLGNDYLDGGLENDSMAGGAGNDTYFVDSAGDKIRDLGLSSDMDKVVLTMAISYLLPEGVESAGMATSGEASLTGNALNNRLSGNDARNGLSGGLGNDSLDGGAGADSLAGGEGDDLMAGGAGNDTLRGGAGVDWADFAAAGVDVKVDLASGKCFGDGADLLFEIENVLAGDGADTLIGSAGANSLEGGAGSDSLSGGEGDDTLAGCFYGKDGGRGSVDTLLGGGGGDLFELGWVGGRFYDDGNAQSGGREDYALITDFTVGKDRLQLDGAAKDYFLGASGVSGVAGTGLFWDGNANGKLDTSDELIAIVRPAGGTTLDAAGVVAKAVFV